MLPHDVFDWDLQLPPILAKDGSRDIVLAAGKQGYVYAIDARQRHHCLEEACRHPQRP